MHAYHVAHSSIMAGCAGGGTSVGSPFKNFREPAGALSGQSSTDGEHMPEVPHPADDAARPGDFQEARNVTLNEDL